MLQIDELADFGEGSDSPPRAIHPHDALRLVAGKTPVEIQIELLQTVGFEGRIGQTEVNAPVFVVAFVLGQAAGGEHRARHERENPATHHDTENQISTSSSERSVISDEPSSSPP